MMTQGFYLLTVSELSVLTVLVQIV